MGDLSDELVILSKLPTMEVRSRGDQYEIGTTCYE